MLTAENVTKKYGSFTAVDDVSVSLGDGVVTVIVGESGSGKSTLARMLSYIESPDSGRVMLGETDMTACSGSRRRSLRKNVQLVMQDAASSLDPHQTAFQLLEEPLKLLIKLDKPHRVSRIGELVEAVQFPRERLKNKVSQLSGGQQKRLCIARALAAAPDHIIFDESFSGLDVTLRRQILTMLKGLQKQLGLSFLIITHDLDTAMFMADRIYVMRCGRIIETLDRPQSFIDFKEDYSKELVKAAEYKRQLLLNSLSRGQQQSSGKENMKESL